MTSPKLKPLFFLVVVLITALAAPWPAMACTTVRVQADNGACVVGRSMEFSIPLQSQVMSMPRGKRLTAQAPGGADGLSWVTKYGFVAANALGQDVAVDGVNEAGLSLGMLWLPCSKFQEVPAGQAKRALRIQDLGNWLLSSFATVAEARAALPQVLVWGQPQPELGKVPPLHVALFDATGAALVVEFVDGKQVIYDNPVGVMTNGPTFDWHLTNLRNYVGLSAYNPPKAQVNGQEIAATGLGDGLRGLPGDWTPPSRFVRVLVAAALAWDMPDAQAAVGRMAHILNTVDIPRGVTREKKQGKILDEYTLWATIKDLANKVFYYRTHDNMGLRKVVLGDLDLSAGQPIRTMPMDAGPAVRDATKRMK